MRPYVIGMTIRSAGREACVGCAGLEKLFVAQDHLRTALVAQHHGVQAVLIAGEVRGVGTCAVNLQERPGATERTAPAEQRLAHLRWSI